MKRQVEILSPAGSYESLKAAIAAGADAVYIGGSRFGARAFADNLNEEKLLEVIDYVHLHGRKIYLTVNTLLKESELKEELYDYLLPYYRQGLDAVIVQDIGVLTFIREHFPDLPIHASTQMTVTDLYGAKFVEKLGVERVVTSREMHIDEIREIHEHTNLEIESFVHGALCYCYSGQCLYSSLIGGRSGNRGQCAQPCRLPYKMNGEKESQYILSPKDICTLEIIPDLVEAGIYSFKIEGRMKKPEYVALVTSMYRKYVDLYLKKGKAGFSVGPKDKEKILDLYNRGGSHKGYYHTQNGREMISITRPNHAGVQALKVQKVKGKNVTARTLVDISAGDVIELPDGKENYTFANGAKAGQVVQFTTHKMQNFSKDMILNRTRNESLIKEIQSSIIEQKVKEKINGKLILSTGSSAKLIIEYKDICLEICGDEVQEALNQPMDASRIEKQLRKTGNTEFEFETLSVELSGNVFMPMQALNELRRTALLKLEDCILRRYRRENQKAFAECKSSEVCSQKTSSFYVYVEEKEQFDVVLSKDYVSRIYVDANMIPHIWNNETAKSIVELAHVHQKEIYLGMPHVFRSKTKAIFESHLLEIMAQGWDGFLVRNLEVYEFLNEKEYDFKIVTDYGVYQFNKCAKEFWENENIESTTAPLELNYKELKEVGLENSELVVYGHFPMMVSAQCITKTTKGCKHQKGRVVFTDRFHKEFTAKNLCDYCYNMIFNTAPVVLVDQREEIEDLSPKAIRLHFTIEGKEKTEQILELYKDVFIEKKLVEEPDMEFTRGHFKRGIK